MPTIVSRTTIHSKYYFCQSSAQICSIMRDSTDIVVDIAESNVNFAIFNEHSCDLNKTPRAAAIAMEIQVKFMNINTFCLFLMFIQCTLIACYSYSNFYYN